jgi:hypothetical protein
MLKRAARAPLPRCPLQLSHCTRLGRVKLSCPALHRLGLEECTVLDSVEITTGHMTVGVQGGREGAGRIPAAVGPACLPAWVEG